LVVSLLQVVAVVALTAQEMVIMEVLVVVPALLLVEALLEVQAFLVKVLQAEQLAVMGAIMLLVVAVQEQWGNQGKTRLVMAVLVFSPVFQVMPPTMPGAAAAVHILVLLEMGDLAEVEQVLAGALWQVYLAQQILVVAVVVPIIPVVIRVLVARV
jgi:hypothetical protein